MAKRFGKVKSYEEWVKPVLVENTLDLLDKEIPRLKEKIKSVHLCLTSDPFMHGYNEIEDLSIAAIKKLNDADIKCTVLTKGLLPKKLAELFSENEYGITLISLDNNYREKYEPGAADYQDRIDALKLLHTKGLKTWVSIEPYPTPNIFEQDLEKILESISFANKIVFGRTNYNKIVSSFIDHKAFYNIQAGKVIRFCEEKGIEYHIKKGTITNAIGIDSEVAI